MPEIAEIRISFQERNLEKFKNQVREFSKDSWAVLNDRLIFLEWVVFISDMCKNDEENKEYLAVARENPNQTVEQTHRDLERKGAGCRVVGQLIQNLMDIERASSGVCDPNETYTINMPPLVVTGRDRFLLRDGGIAIVKEVINKL